MSYSGLGIQTLERRQSRVAAATENQLDLARTLYNAGQDAFRAGSYEVALGYYNDAWATLPTRNILLSIGSAMLRLGRFQDALYRFARYLRENPDGPERSAAEDGVAVAQAALTRQAAAQGSPPPAPPPEVPPEVLATKVAEAPRSDAAAAAAGPSALDYPDPWTERSTIGIWIATGIGVAMLAGWGWWMLRKRAPKPNRRHRRRTPRRRRSR